ncbi:acyl-CoA thioesterase [Nitrospirillum amazonense]|nr:acyl-CoA thioesterase [Nitrospirillum amazonense]
MDTDAASVLTEMVFPGLANHYGTLFGGQALNLMGKAAFIAASRRAGCDVVMVAADRVVFRRPIPVGHLLELTARVVRIGRSSMTVAVSGQSRPPKGGPNSHAMDGVFEMVAVDADGRPKPVFAQPGAAVARKN